jgi:hypothetical protein
MALTAQIGDLQKAKASTSVEKVKREGGAKKESDGKKKTRADKYAKKYAWKLIAPATGEPTTKEDNNLGAWVIHLPSKKEKPASDKIMTLTWVLQAIQEESGVVMSDDNK